MKTNIGFVSLWRLLACAPPATKRPDVSKLARFQIRQAISWQLFHFCSWLSLASGAGHSNPGGGHLASRQLEERRSSRCSSAPRSGVPIVGANAFKSGRAVSQDARFLADHPR